MASASDEPLSQGEPTRDVLREIRDHFGVVGETAAVTVDCPMVPVVR